MDGSKIAKEKYFVTAYPTSFLIDFDGTVLDRTTGFSEDDYEKLKTKLKKLLKSSR